LPELKEMFEKEDAERQEREQELWEKQLQKTLEQAEWEVQITHSAQTKIFDAPLKTYKL
jgi:hypothetical protein